jgi:hypothetical protein
VCFDRTGVSMSRCQSDNVCHGCWGYRHDFKSSCRHVVFDSEGACCGCENECRCLEMDEVSEMNSYETFVG